MSSPTDRERFLEAVRCRNAGDLDGMRAALVGVDEGDSRTWVQRARLHLNGSVYGAPARRLPKLDWALLPGALEAAERACELAPADVAAQLVRAEVYSRWGRGTEAIATYRHLAESHEGPLPPRVLRRLADAGEHDLAHRVAARHPDLCPPDVAAAIALGREDDVALRRAITPLSAADRFWWAARAGDLPALRDASADDPSAAARRALWSGDSDEARRLSEGRTDRVARLVHAASQVADPDADPVHALRVLARTTDEDTGQGTERATVMAWLAEALLRRGAHAEARTLAGHAREAAGRFHLAGETLYLLALLVTRQPQERVATSATAPLHPQAPHLFPDADLSVAEATAACWRLLDELGGNRSPHPTRLSPDGLTTWPLAEDPRTAAKAIHGGLFSRDATQILDAYRALQDRHPSSSLPYTYEGELHLWRGDWAPAEACFRRSLALDEATVWAWIGLGAAQLFTDQLDLAMQTWRRGVAACRFEGPTLFAYRGECALRLGRRDDALSDLHHAVRKKPGRLSAWLLFALAQDSPAAQQRASAALRHGAVGLWLEACAAIDWPPDRWGAPPLRAALGLMRGNRSSSTITWLPPGGGPLRLVTAPTVGGR
jgi:tetratricopeptide (TPR) repeat protein